MGSWTIYSKNRTPKYTVKELEYHDTWMGEEYVTVSITSPTPLELAIGDYLVYRGLTYSVYSVPGALKQARKNTYGEAFKYDNVKLSSRGTELTDIRFLDYVLDDNNIHYTSLPTFAFYAETVDDLLDRLQANTDREGVQWLFISPSYNRTMQRYEQGTPAYQDAAQLWEQYFGGSHEAPVYEKTNVNISIDKQSVWDGLVPIKNDFGLNFFSRERAVIVGGEGLPAEHIFRYGKGNGLYQIERVADQDQKVTTKLYAYGSDKNLPVRYYANLTRICFARMYLRPSAGSNILYLDLVWNRSYVTGAADQDGKFPVVVSINGTTYNVKAYPMEVGARSLFTIEASVSLGFVTKSMDIIFVSGIDKDKFPASNVRQESGGLPNNMAVQVLMLPGFPIYALSDLCRCTYSGDYTIFEVRKTPSDSYSEFMRVEGNHPVTFSDDPLQPYILSGNADTLGIKEGDVHFVEDNDDNGLKEIYPSIEGMTRGDVEGTSSTERLDEIVSCDVIQDNGVFAEGVEIQNFNLVLKDIGFNLKEAFDNAGGNMTISMKDGYCGGRDFSVHSVTANNNGTWTLNVERSHDEGLDLWFPYSTNAAIGQAPTSNEPYQIRTGDHFVLTEIEIGDTSYIWAAAMRMLRKSVTYLLNNDYTRFTYLPKVDEIYMARQHDESQTQAGIKSLHDTLKSGMLMLFDDEDFDVDGSVFIDLLTIKENGNNGIPTYDVVLRNDKQVGTMQRIQNQINSLTSYIGGGGGGLSVSQIRSLINTYGGELFLSKVNADIAAGRITFQQGLEALAHSVFGDGFYLGDSVKYGIDGDGNATLQSLQAAEGEERLRVNKSLSVENELNVGGDASVEGLLTADNARINSVKSEDYTGDGLADTGWNITNSHNGHSKMTIDEIYVRMKAVFEALEVKKRMVTGGDQSWTSAANVIVRTDYIDEDGKMLGYDEIKVPWLLKYAPFLLGKNPLRGIYSSLAPIKRSYEDIDPTKIKRVRCYFLAEDSDGNKVDNLWSLDDLVRCQTFNLDKQTREGGTQETNVPSEDGTHSYTRAQNTFWWRKIIAVSQQAVTIEDRKYHYFDVVYDYDAEQAGVNTEWCAAGSDIPCAGDDACQFGNSSNPDRMNAIAIEINGSANADAPCVKAYRGIYTFDLKKCWYGGKSCQKMNLSPSTGFSFYGPMFEYITEYGTEKVTINRGDWEEIAFDPDDDVDGSYPAYSDDRSSSQRSDGSDKRNVRKCYYYNQVSHNGSIWLCTMANDGFHWRATEQFVYNNVTYVVGQRVPDGIYAALDASLKVKCEHVRNYTSDEPSTSSAAWKKQVSQGTSIKSVTSTYAKQSPTAYTGTPPTTGWEPSISALGTIEEGWYVWTKSVTTYSDTLSDTTTYTVTKWGIDGDGIHNIETKFYEDSRLLTQQQLAALAESKWKEYSGLALTQGDYIYTRTKITYDKSQTPTISYQVNRIGEDGVGYVATEEYYVLSDSDTTVPTGHPYTGDQPYKKYTAAEWRQIQITGGWSESRPTYQGDANKYLWNFEVSFDTDGNAMVTRPICIGNYAKGIQSIVETYAISAYDTAPQAGSYPTDITTWTDEAHDCAPTDDKPYQWNKTVTSYSDGSSDTFYHVSAVKGTRGRGITNVNTYFKADTTTPSTPSGAPAQSGWSDDGNSLITNANSSKHLYESTCTTYTDGTYSWTTPLDDGLISDMAATEEEFALADSETTAPTTGWSSSVTPTSGKWIWSRTKLTFKSGNPKYVSVQCVGYCGTNGNGIVSITRTFAISNVGTTASETTEPTHQDSWTTDSPAVTEQYPYLWAKEVVVFTDTTKNTTKYYCIGTRGDNGVDAQDVEWVYIRTKTNTAPTIINDNTYTDTNGKTFASDDHLPQVSGNENIENNQSKYECTDDPKGVTEIWKYEWEIKRTKGAATNGHRSWNYYQGAMTLHNNFAESAFIIDIDNDNDMFGTDSDSKVLVSQTRKTAVTLFNGAAPQALTALSATLTYEDGTAVPTSVATKTTTLNTGVVEITVLANNTPNAHTEIVASISATCSYGTKTAVFKLNKVMGGAPGLNPVIYQLEPTQKTFSFTRDASNNLTPSSKSSNINVARTEGNTTTILNTAQTGITYQWGFDEGTAQDSGKAVGTTISVSNTQANSHYQVWVELSTGDRETLPIVKDGAKGDPGTSITKASADTYRYATNNTGVRPAADSQDWSTTKPTLQAGYWLYTETTIHWSDNTTTVIYSDERNPNDGVSGQDIIVDRNEVTYALTQTNQQPADSAFGPYPSTLTQGWWLWSKSTTYYKKATTSESAGSSNNYSVSYIAEDGAPGRGISSVTEYYKANNSTTAPQVDDSAWDTDPNLSHRPSTEQWDADHIYLWNYETVTYTSGTTVERTTPQIVAIWTEDGEPGKGIDSIQNYYKITNSLTPPQRTDSGWDDDPIAPTAENPYLYNYEAITWVNPSSTTYTAVQMIGHYGHDGISVRAQYSANGTSNWHDDFSADDKWMRTSSDNGTTWSTAMKIVGENGSETDFSFGISEYKTTTNAQTAPSDVSTWSDAPMAVTTQKPYLWSKVQQKDGHGTATSTRYIRLTGEDGKSITKQSEEVKYKVADNGTTTPTGTWYDTKAAAIAAKPWGPDKYMWTRTTITWSDTSTTVLYSAERNPNDGNAGQDIVVDGSTVMKYYVGDSNTTHPAEDSSDWKDLSQVTQTQGKWLWSKATTWYRKSSSSAGSKDAGYSVNYNVSYISKDGKTGRGIESITEYYQATNSSQPMVKPTSTDGWDGDPNLSHLTDKWDANHIYLWNMEQTVYTESDGTTTTEYTIPQILAIWTKDGDAGRGIDSIQNKYCVTSSSTTPAKEGESGAPTWYDAPQTPGNGQYLWNYEIITWINPSGTTSTDVQMIGYSGTNGENAVKIDLDNEMDSIPCDSDGVVTSETTLTTGVRIYVGATPVTSGVTVKSIGKIAGVNAVSSVSGGVVTVSWKILKNTNLSVDKFTAQIVLTWKSHDYYGTFTASVVKSGEPGVSPTIYTLVSSVSSVVKKEDGTYSVNNVSCTRQKNTGGTITDNTTDGTIECYVDGTKKASYTNNENIAVTTFTTDVRFVFKVDGKVVDTETTPMISDGKTPQKGVDYVDGDDAYTVKIEPADLLFTQSTTKVGNTYPLVDATKTAVVSVKKGSSNSAVEHRTTIQGTPSGCTVSVSGDTIRVTGVIGNYTEGSVAVRVTITNGPVFDLVLNVYYNLLGTWKSDVEAGVETITAEKVEHMVDGGVLLGTQTYNYDSVSSAAGRAETWHQEMIGQDGWINQTNTRISNAEGNISTVSKTRPQEDIFSKGLSDWVTNDTGYPDANFDNKYPRYYAVGEITDIYSPVVALTAGEYCFSAYVPSDREFDTNGNTIALMQGCTASDPGSGSFIPASNASTVSGDTITIQVTENERIVEKTYYRRYATFRITGNEARCSINVWGDGTKFADVVRPKLEVGSSVTPYVMSSSVVKQTADALTVQINGKASQSDIDIAADHITATIKSQLGETGINIDEKTITMKAEQTIFKDLSGREMISFEMVEYEGDNLPSLVFWDNKGKQGNNKSFVLNWKGLIDMTQHSTSMSWGPVAMYGTLNTDNSSFVEGRKVYAETLWFNIEPHEGERSSIISVTKYMYYAGYTISEGRKIWNPVNAGNYDGKMYDSSDTDFYLPTGVITAGWYITEITEYKTGTEVWRKTFSFKHYTSGMPDSSFVVCVESLNVYDIHGQIISSYYQINELLTDPSVTTGRDTVGEYMIIPTVN